MEMLYGIIFLIFGFGFTVICLSMGRSVLSNMGGEFSFNLLLQPDLIFIYIFTIIGLFLFIYGLRKTVQNIVACKKGIEAYGIVVKREYSEKYKSRSGYYVISTIVVKEDGSIGLYKEVDHSGYEPGRFLKVKYYKNDINILDYVRRDDVPDLEKYRLEAAAENYLK